VRAALSRPRAEKKRAMSYLIARIGILWGLFRFAKYSVNAGAAFGAGAF
jgi:hypothetical protein